MSTLDVQELAHAMASASDTLIDAKGRRVNAPGAVLSRLAFFAVQCAIEAPPRLQTASVGVSGDTVRQLREALTAIGFDWKAAVAARQRAERQIKPSTPKAARRK